MKGTPFRIYSNDITFEYVKNWIQQQFEVLDPKNGWKVVRLICDHVDKITETLVKQTEEEDGLDFDFLNHGSEIRNYKNEKNAVRSLIFCYKRLRW